MSTLCLVPTPIGNLSDISPRARQALADADFIAAEDDVAIEDEAAEEKAAE